MVSYQILLHLESLKHIIAYKDNILSKKITPGKYLQIAIKSLVESGLSLDKMTVEGFLQLILSTKKIMCFAESEVKGGGRDWNSTELEILGNVSVAMAVQVFDNGVWNVEDESFKEHSPPLVAHLLFIPGPLLESFIGPTPDLRAVLNWDTERIDHDKYTMLVERRLLPTLLYASVHAGSLNKRALLVIPGIGCGAFAGKYRGQMGEHLNQALQSILKRHNPILVNIACVRYDPFVECADGETKFNNILYRVRQNIGPYGRPQLSAVHELEETVGEFEDCNLYKVVAWDHVSLPGNDYFAGNRMTDDGVTAAATDSMTVLTGVPGHYNRGHYLPPQGLGSWLRVAETQHCRLVAEGNVLVGLADGSLKELDQSLAFL